MMVWDWEEVGVEWLVGQPVVSYLAPSLLCLSLVPIIMVVLECYTITWIQVILQTLKPTIRLENIVPEKCHGKKIYRVTFGKARSKDRKQCLLGIIPLEGCDTLLLGMQIFCGTHLVFCFLSIGLCLLLC